MENLSIKNISRIIIGGGMGYFLGAAIGMLASGFVWAIVAVVSGEFVFYSAVTFALNFLWSMVVIALLSLFIKLVDKRLFHGRTSPWVWFSAGVLAVIYVMTTYGFNVVFHPEDSDQFGYFSGDAGIDTDLLLVELAMPLGKRIYLYYGIGSGILIGSLQGAAAGLSMAFRETFKKRKSEDKKEFEEYSKFINSRLKK